MSQHESSPSPTPFNQFKKYAARGIVPLSIMASTLLFPGVSDADTDLESRSTAAHPVHVHYAPEHMDVSVSPEYRVGTRLYAPTSFHGDSGMFVAPRIASGVTGNTPGVMISEFFVADDDTLYKIDSVKKPHVVTTSCSVTIPHKLADVLRSRDSSLDAQVVFNHYSVHDAA